MRWTALSELEAKGCWLPAGSRHVRGEHISMCHCKRSSMSRSQFGFQLGNFGGWGHQWNCKRVKTTDSKTKNRQAESRAENDSRNSCRELALHLDKCKHLSTVSITSAISICLLYVWLFFFFWYNEGGFENVV